MKNFISEGRVIKAVSASAVASGGGLAIGSLFGIAVGDVAAGETGVFLVSGIVVVPVKTGDTFTAGVKVYWDSANSYITTTADNNTFAGYYIAADGDNADIRLQL